MKYISCESVALDAILGDHPLKSEISAVSRTYPFRLSASYAALIKECQDPVWRQCVPDPRELEDVEQQPDPLHEASLSPVPGLIHRYPDRVVMLVSSRCPVYCRFCMRKRMVGLQESALDANTLEAALEYIENSAAIRDVVLSGGDPLMLDDETLHYILSRLRKIGHVSLIRIGTRMPVTHPERITPQLCGMLKQFHPLYINTHFNHPEEVSDAASRACSRLADAGIPLGNQTVLLKGVNDDVDTMRALMMKLLSIRVRPYYIHQLDLVRGTAHFRTSVEKGLEVVRGLRGHVSGMAVPHYVIDLPGGKGKVALLPDQPEREGNVLTLTTYTGEKVVYADVVD